MRKIISVAILLVLSVSTFGWYLAPENLNRSLRMDGFRMFAVTKGKCVLYPDTVLVIVRSGVEMIPRNEVRRAFFVMNKSVRSDIKKNPNRWSKYAVCLKFHRDTRPHSRHRVDGMIVAYVMAKDHMLEWSDIVRKQGIDSKASVKMFSKRLVSLSPKRFKAMEWSGAFRDTRPLSMSGTSYGD